MAECGSELIFRPTGRCDKCGRKAIEVKQNATNVTGSGVGVGQGLSEREGGREEGNPTA